jgi:hypothetical protein
MRIWVPIRNTVLHPVNRRNWKAAGGGGARGRVVCERGREIEGGGGPKKGVKGKEGGEKEMSDGEGALK